MANPTAYTSLTGHYGRATEGSEQGTWTFGNPLETYRVYSPYIRMFIPPGTIVSDFDVLTYDVPSATSRHQIPPDSGYTNDTGYFPATLTEVTDSNCTVHLTDEGVLYSLSDSTYGGIGIEQAGWYYVNMGPKGEGPVFTQQFIAKVDAVKYNAWYDTYIKDEAGWAKYVESVTTYSIKTAGTIVDYVYTSVHQPGGVRENWYPGSSSVYSVGKIVDLYDEPNTLKMYIPPGTMSIQADFSFTYNLYESARTNYCTVQYKSPPLSNTDFWNFEPAELWQIDGQSWSVNQYGGYIIVISGGGTFDVIKEGNWLYFITGCLPDAYGNYVVHFNGSVSVDTALYTEWYNTTLWDAWGDPVEASVATGSGSGYYDPVIETGIFPGVWPVVFDRNNHYPFPPPF